MEILYTSGAIHTKIKKLFISPPKNDRRVCIVAYIGSDVKAFLPSPKGILIICNPNPVATSIDAITYLRNKGADVRFSNSLHMKVYYSGNRGCIITSANLSNNALGSGNLKETGIYINSDEIDIDRLIKYSKPYKPTKNDLSILDKKSKIITASLKKAKVRFPKDKPLEYSLWYSSIEYKKWKISSYESKGFSFSQNAINLAKKEFGVKEPSDGISASQGQLKTGDWLLCYELNKKLKVTDIGWMYIDVVVSVGKKEKSFEKENPFQAIQISPLSKCPTPPFKINSKFKKSLEYIIADYGDEKVGERSTLILPQSMLKNLNDRYNETKTG
jgi:hypothetical protein